MDSRRSFSVFRANSRLILSSSLARISLTTSSNWASRWLSETSWVRLVSSSPHTEASLACDSLSAPSLISTSFLSSLSCENWDCSSLCMRDMWASLCASSRLSTKSSCTAVSSALAAVSSTFFSSLSSLTFSWLLLLCSLSASVRFAAAFSALKWHYFIVLSLNFLSFCSFLKSNWSV